MKPGERTEVRRHLAAPPAQVFAAFANAEVVARWLTPAPEVKLTVLELDFREGGHYRFAYNTPEGQRRLVGGVYSKIEAPTRVEFSWLIEPPDVHAGIESQALCQLRRARTAPIYSSCTSASNAPTRTHAMPRAGPVRSSNWSGYSFQQGNE